MQRERKVADIVKSAAEQGIVVPAFNVFHLPMICTICDTLAKHNTFGLVEVSRIDIVKFQAKGVAEVAEEYRKCAKPMTALHLDHTPVIDEDGILCDWKSIIAEAISVGYDSVMIDASRLPLEENIAVTRQVVEMAHPEGIVVEAELGAVLGHEEGPLPPYDELFESKRGFTDPDEARRFVRETGVDWLSVSVGSVHGAISAATKDQPKVQARLDIERLRRLRDATGVPLVLHGGSGVQPAYVAEGIRNGIAKINIGTDIRQPYERVMAAGRSVSEAQSASAEVILRLIREVYHIEGSASRLMSE